MSTTPPHKPTEPLSVTTPERSMSYEPSLTESEEIVTRFPWVIVLGVVAMALVLFGLARIAIVASERRDAEKKRGDLLQKSVDSLRARSEENQKFFEIVKELMVAQSAEDRKALVEQLKGIQFGSVPPPTATTTTTTPSRGPAAPRTTTTTSTTTAPRPPPSTTTTTAPPPSPPPSRPCVTTPVASICPPATPTGRNQPS